MSNFNEFIDTIEDGAKELAKKTLKDFQHEAEQDSQKFLEDTKEDLKRWTLLLAEGKLTKDDFEWLVLSKKDVAEMIILKQTGLGLVKIDRYRNAFFNLVIDSAFDIFI
ncbi:hypothetical protein G5Y08_004233 [Vibrio parahaemolyticus]|nr:hypothetical protein [Vibrio parahaemolyticus]EHD2277589.1 hypothetical protein [Vibrio parahaemolyticus]EHH2498322.1 hypothetical protein [Vibrio parahaemolyticus]EID4328223.1 hypothetical protein [Vibrio parahaemolyticus]